MPYTKNSDLPASVADVLPKHAKEIYRAAFNSAWEQYQEPEEEREETAHKVAWSAVKKEYEKDETSGKWVKKSKETTAERVNNG